MHEQMAEGGNAGLLVAETDKQVIIIGTFVDMGESERHNYS